MISEPSRHELAHIVGPLVKVLVCSSFQRERAVRSPSYRPWGCHGPFALLPYSESVCFFLAQHAELGLIRIAAVFPAPPYELSSIKVRAAVAEVPPAFARQSPSRCTSTCSATTVIFANLGNIDHCARAVARHAYLGVQRSTLSVS